MLYLCIQGNNGVQSHSHSYGRSIMTIHHTGLMDQRSQISVLYWDYSYQIVNMWQDFQRGLFVACHIACVNFSNLHTASLYKLKNVKSSWSLINRETPKTSCKDILLSFQSLCVFRCVFNCTFSLFLFWIFSFFLLSISLLHNLKSV